MEYQILILNKAILYLYLSVEVQMINNIIYWYSIFIDCPPFKVIVQ